MNAFEKWWKANGTELGQRYHDGRICREGIARCAWEAALASTQQAPEPATVSLEERWYNLRKYFMGTGVGYSPLYAQIEARYAPTNNRQYHTLHHIQNCLNDFDRVRHRSKQPQLLELALWFHDIGYNSKEVNNEVRSCIMALDVMEALEISRKGQTHVLKLIAVTAVGSTPLTTEEQLMSDIDLCGLGYSPTAYDHHTALIREEYSWASDEVFYASRKALLKKLLERSPMYSTPELQDLYGVQARVNIENELRGYADV